MNIRNTKYGPRDAFPRPPTPAVYKKIAYSFLGITVLVIVGALWISSVRARVTVIVKHDTQSVQGVVELSKSPELGQLKGRVVQGSFEKIQEFAVKDLASSTVDAPVSGIVKISNQYSRSQTLVKTTRLSMPDGRVYRIDKTVIIPPLQSVTVNAVSDGKGKVFILPPDTKLSIPGLYIDMQKWIYATTVSGFQGGAGSVKTVSQSDVNDAYKTLHDVVLDQAKKTLRAEANVQDDWDAVYIDTESAKKTNITPGQSSDQFMASEKLDVTAVFYPSKEMISLVKQKLLDKMSEGRELVEFNPAKVVLKVDTADANLEKARITFSADAISRLTENSASLSKNLIAGLSIEEAKTKLSTTDGVLDVQIIIQPAWIGKLPTPKDHIDLIVK